MEGPISILLVSGMLCGIMTFLDYGACLYYEQLFFSFPFFILNGLSSLFTHSYIINLIKNTQTNVLSLPEALHKYMYK